MFLLLFVLHHGAAHEPGFYFMEGKTLIESLKILIGAPLMVSVLFYCLMRWPTATFIGCGILLTIGYSITGVK